MTSRVQTNKYLLESDDDSGAGDAESFGPSDSICAVSTVNPPARWPSSKTEQGISTIQVPEDENQQAEEETQPFRDAQEEEQRFLELANTVEPLIDERETAAVDLTVHVDSEELLQEEDYNTEGLPPSNTLEHSHGPLRGSDGNETVGLPANGQDTGEVEQDMVSRLPTCTNGDFPPFILSNSLKGSLKSRQKRSRSQKARIWRRLQIAVKRYSQSVAEKRKERFMENRVQDVQNMGAKEKKKFESCVRAAVSRARTESEAYADKLVLHDWVMDL